jgi:hypothetical protein
MARTNQLRNGRNAGHIIIMEKNKMNPENRCNRIAETSDVKKLTKWYKKYPKDFNVNRVLILNEKSSQALLQEIADNLEANFPNEDQRALLQQEILSLPNVPLNVIADALKNKKDSFPYWPLVALARIKGTAGRRAQLSKDEIDYYREIVSCAGLFMNAPDFNSNLEYLEVMEFLKENGFPKYVRTW